MEDPEHITDEIVRFYSSLYQEPFSWRPLLDNLEFDSIYGEEAEWLERPFDVDEVIGVVRSLNGDKALGPDGFSLAFYHSCWDVIKDDVISMFNEFA